MEKVDQRAVISLVAGVAAIMFAGTMGWLHVMSLVLGGMAMWTGIAVMREGRKGMGLSVAGVILGTIAVCAWILSKVYG